MAATPHLPLIQTRDPLPSRTIWRTTDAELFRKAQWSNHDWDSLRAFAVARQTRALDTWCRTNDAQEVVLEDGDRSGD